jgi:LuxR family quorum-sensing system transcriptional regulator CciR
MEGQVMSSFDDVQTFVREAGDVRTIAALETFMEGIVSELGFEYFALGHHVNVVSGGLVQIIHYPPSWSEMVLERHYITQDPVLIASETSAAGFKWSEISKLIELTNRQKQILEEARSMGMGEGFTVPMHVPGECAGSCNFGRKPGKPLKESVLPAAQFVGGLAFEAARKLARQQTSPELRHSQRPALTARQLDCLVLIGRGKTEAEVARLLGVQPNTVHKHIDNAKLKYGVSSRHQLIVRALFDRQISFRDLLLH